MNSVRTSTTLKHEIRTVVNGYVVAPHVVPKGSAMLHVAAYEGYHKCIDVLVQAGADVNEIIGRGETPLIIATRKEYSKCVATLLSSGADPNIKSNGLRRYTALMYAIRGCNVEIVTMLLSVGADPHLGHNTWTGLSWAKSECNYAIKHKRNLKTKLLSTDRKTEIDEAVDRAERASQILEILLKHIEEGEGPVVSNTGSVLDEGHECSPPT